MVERVFIVLLVCLAVPCTLADEPTILTSDTFQPKVDEGKPVFVKFFAPWCGHCKRLAPTWDELAGKFTGTSVTIAKVDCTTETKLCADNGVRGYPTLKLFTGSDNIKDYKGSRDIKSLADFVTANVVIDKVELDSESQVEEEVKIDEKGLAHLTDRNFDLYLAAKPGVHFVKFYAPWCGHCQRLAPTWDELAAQYETNSLVHISKVDCTVERDTCQRHGIKGYPTLLLFEDGLVVKKYSGNRQLEDLLHFVNQHASVPGEESEAGVPGVVELTSATFADKISNGNTFVKFYAPWCGHCKRLAPVWEKLADVVHSTTPSVTIAKVDCTVEQELCIEYKVHSYPTLILFESGQVKDEYKGARDLDSLEQFLAEKAS